MQYGSKGYDPRGSGLVKGGGRMRFSRKRRAARLPFKRLGDHSGLRELPDYDPELTYTHYDLAMLAEKMLLENSKPATEDPAYLHVPMLRERQKHEIYVSDGIPDPAFNEGLYWRTHPNGLKFVRDPDLRRATGAGFYDTVSPDAERVEAPPERPVIEKLPCSFSGCDHRSVMAGLCPGHYQQQLKGIELQPLREQSHRLTAEEERTIQRRYLEGVSKEDLVLQFDSSMSSIKRALVGFGTKQRKFRSGVGI